MANGELKEQVRRFWNEQSCDTQVARSAKFTLPYYEEIENFRYRDQPFIHAFAQFTRARGRNVLEVGVGAGTDFIQWLRAGAVATGIDLTQEALDNVTHRIHLYGLPPPEQLCLADAENLPFRSNSFDIGYSFGVLHHSPDTTRAIGELVRVIQPGGEMKIMLYNRRSIYVANQWIKHALLKGTPWKPLSWVLFHHIESAGTKGYTRGELRRLLATFPLENVRVHTEVTSADYLSASAMPPLNWCNRLLLRWAGSFQDWDSIDYVERGGTAKEKCRENGPRFSGNRLGFFHCISASKAGAL